MFAPVGAGGECIKIAPPLTIPEDALTESIQVLEESVDEVLPDPGRTDASRFRDLAANE
jgi:acetylornithine/succinyldiaminopimelate/putrescine aminotransferase